MSPAGSMTLMRIIPIIVLVAVALISQQAFGISRGAAAILGLVCAIAVRLALPRFWNND